MQPRLFEEWIEKVHQRDANLFGVYARPIDERSLVRGGGGYNQGSFVYLAKACGGWVFAGVNGQVLVDVPVRTFLSESCDKPRCARRQAVYSPNRLGYEVELRGQGGGGSEVWLHARLLCGCKARCEVLADHHPGAGSGEQEVKKILRCRAPIVGFAAARPL